MTKKDFELIAGAISRVRHQYGTASDIVRLEHARRIAAELADALATTNPKFDRARFLAACGVQS